MTGVQTCALPICVSQAASASPTVVAERGDPNAAAGTAHLPPTRTLVTFTGMGFHSNHWWAKGEGAAMELGPCLKPLEPWKLCQVTT